MICSVGCILTIGINGLHYVDKGFKTLINKYKGELIFLEKKQHDVLKEII